MNVATVPPQAIDTSTGDVGFRGIVTLSGDGLCIGRDSGDNVSQEYKSPGTFTGGTIQAVEVNVGKEQYVDLEMAAVAAFAVE